MNFQLSCYSNHLYPVIGIHVHLLQGAIICANNISVT